MARLVVRLSPLAKAGALITVAGVLLAVYGHLQEVPRAEKLSRGVVAIGVVLYFVARFRALRKR